MTTITKLSQQDQAAILRWPKELDIGIFEADTRNKKVSLNNWSKMDLTNIDYAKEMASGRYDNGIAIRCGRTISGKHYVIALDFDRWKAVIAWFGSWERVLILAEKTLVEWHDDNKESIHVILKAEQPVENRKIHIDGGLLEIKCEGQALFVSPSIHKEGRPYSRLGSCGTPELLQKEDLLRVKSKIEFLCQNYMSDVDKQTYDRWLDEPSTVLGIHEGRHDATKFKVCRYFWKYSGEWLDLSDQERFKRAWDWHLKHCNPARPMKEFDDICKWTTRTFKKQRDELHDKVRKELTYGIGGGHLWQEEVSAASGNEKDKDLKALSVSEALRILPEVTENHTSVLKVGGVISSLRPVFKMIAGEYGKCPKCRELYHKHYERPSFFPLHMMIPFCTKFDAPEHPIETVGVDKGKGRFVDEGGNEYEFKKDSNGKLVRTHVWLNMGFEYRNAIIVEIQDSDKFDDLEKLEVIVFDSDTENIRAGEQITITGQIWIEHLKQTRDSKLSARLYAHSIKYEARREISLSNLDKDAIHRFVKRFGNATVDKLSQMFAPSVIGYGHIKKGLVLSASSCANDFRSSKTFKHRIRIHSFLIGDPGLAKSILLREIVKLVPNSRFESGQNSTGKSLTAIVSKEGGENTILRLGPVPFAKEGICSINELGRMSMEDQAPLLDVMEEGEFSINKYGVNAHIRSPTIIIGSANPTSNSALRTEKITLDDIPAIKPIIDRFDLIFVVRTTRDVDAIREYADAKSKIEDGIVPNYNPYLEKHLLYAKRFNPKISDDARVMLNQYYINIARKTGSPRIRETVYKVARMVARLKLKSVVDADDAKEACQFYNVVLNEWEQIVSVPGNPRDITFNECLYKLEAAQSPMSFDELVDKVCRDEYIDSYIGPNRKARENKKLRTILDMLLNHSQVKRVNLKPIVLQWISKTKNDRETVDAPYAPYAPSEKKSSDDDLRQKAEISDVKTGNDSFLDGSHRAHRSHSLQDFDINAVQIVNINTDGISCDAYIGRRWKKVYGSPPMCGNSGYWGNPFVIGKEGNRKQCLQKYEEWLYHGTEVVNGRDPGEYRRWALAQLPGHYKWGCHCKPEACHGDILLKWMNEQQQLKLQPKKREWLLDKG